MASSRTSPDLGPSSPEAALTKEQLQTWGKNGYLVIPDALDQKTVSSLLDETRALLDNFSLEDHPMTKFSTGGESGGEHVGDDYFLNSGDKIRFFFEEGTVHFSHPSIHISFLNSFVRRIRLRWETHQAKSSCN